MDSLLPSSVVANYTAYAAYADGPARFDSWCSENDAPLSAAQIRSIVDELVEWFGFQPDNGSNIYQLLMSQLDSRASRMSCPNSLLSLHSDYVGGDHANYRKWYFAAHYQLDHHISPKTYAAVYSSYLKSVESGRRPNHDEPVNDINRNWKSQMSQLVPRDQVVHIALYLLIWGEANNVRFMPECICFLFKCALDHYYLNPRKVPLTPFLDDVVTPLYRFIRDQQYKLVDGRWLRNGKDHEDIIGYDDVNQFFWFPQNLQNLKLKDNCGLLELPRESRFARLKDVDWSQSFYKTFKEKRTWFHALTNFNRIWIIHVSVFWYYTSFNSTTLFTKDYSQLLDNTPPPQVTWTVVALGGFLACVISLFAAILEWWFVPRKFPGAQNLLGRVLLLFMLALINIGPSVYILGFLKLDVFYVKYNYMAIGQVIFSILTTIYLGLEAPANYFKFLLPRDTGHQKLKAFTANFPKISKRGRTFSILLWFSVFICKFCESYFFLTLSLKDPARVLSSMMMTRCHGDVWLGPIFCKHQAKLTVVLLYLTDLVLFFLDTYLWYIICNSIFSVGLSLSTGVSIFTPWKNVFARLPERLQSKILYTSHSQTNIISISEVWNSIIFSMFKEHLISSDQMSLLIYSHQFSEGDLFRYSKLIKQPSFFMFQDDNSVNLKDFLRPGGEAERRISFFAHSLSCPIPEPIPIESLPAFTVFVPHYSEKILLGLKEVIKESDESRISVLDYLKQLKKYEWDLFVRDTRVLTANSSSHLDSSFIYDSENQESTSIVKTRSARSAVSDANDDIPLNCIGFKDSSYENTLRTRIWASLRSQTLYRTISGFMNYNDALKILYKAENIGDIPVEDETLSNFATRKFRFLVSMQRFQQFSDAEKANVSQLLEAFPSLEISYIEEEVDSTTNEITYYSVLLDNSTIDANGNSPRKFRIRLSGNPILGDGKSDNQNHSVIFYRGEYIQVIDANQDNYLEECMKIKSVLAEFEQYNIDPSSDYDPNQLPTTESPVAILGAREYIFSENIGALGDIAAAKEQTFGTLFARTLAEIGGKLHYGHPDFLNAIFMLTRGGVSKAQKGLHLNEDIYAGMQATCRGGRIKHCDYYQCGKGRDLGFGSIINFTIKIGAGMGEQLLSREYFYLGTSLPIDRFLSFYYAHAGFHLNNLFITLSVSLFMVFLICLGSLKNESIVCSYKASSPITDLETPIGCYNLIPVVHWVTRFVLSVFICFFISFVPLVFQEIVAKGPLRGLLRMLYHLLSLSPLFEVFVSQIYSKSLLDNLCFGGARYIATGRGFATSRLPFSILFSKYATQSIYSGSHIFLGVMFASRTVWQPALLWFWITFISMGLAPFLFNPHQFVWTKFFLDYGRFLRWLSKGNRKRSKESWYSFSKQQRGRFVGYKKKAVGGATTAIDRGMSLKNSLMQQIALPGLITFIYFLCYFFINSQNGVVAPEKTNLVLRIVMLAAFAPIANLVVIVCGFAVTCLLGPLLGICCSYPASVLLLSRIAAVLIVYVNFELLFLLEGWDISRALVGLVVVLSAQEFMRGIVYTFLLTKELRDDTSNRSWWSGKWFTSGLGLMAVSQPLRELLVKVIEQCQFGYDFVLAHCLLACQVPILLVPFIDRIHTSILFWSKPSSKFRRVVRSKRVRAKERTKAVFYGLSFVLVCCSLTGIVLIPALSGMIPDIREYLPAEAYPLFQPVGQKNNDTGDRAPLTVLREKPGVKSMSTIS